MALNSQSTLERNTRSWQNVTAKTFWQVLLVVIGIVGLAWLALYNLGYSPVPWFDEGEHLRVPKTLILYGQYAVTSADGFRYFGPTIGVGPTVLLPVALSFKLFGIGLVQGRIIIVLYLAVVIALYWLCSLKLWKSRPVALVSMALLIVMPGIDLIMLGRQGLGEIPALAFFLAGLLAWWKAGQEKPALKWLVVAGTLWGIAAITKSNYGLLLPPALFLAWLANHFYYRQPGWNWKAFLIPLVLVAGGLGGWYLIILLFLGGGDFASNFNLLRTASGGSAFVFAPARMLSGIKFLFSPDNFFGLPVFGILYGLWLIRKPGTAHYKLLLPLVFSLVWLGWFCFASVAWPRYAFPALALCPLFIAGLAQQGSVLYTTRLRYVKWRIPAALGIILVLAALSLWGLSRPVSKILTVDDSAQQLATYLNQNVSQTALIETWESELGFLTDHRYHYPPPEMLDKAVRLKWLNIAGQPLAELYQPEKLAPDYLITGTFGVWNELYPPELLSSRYTLVAKFGNYTLYHRLT